MLFSVVIILVCGYGAAGQGFAPDHPLRNNELPKDIDVVKQLIEQMKRFEEKLSDQAMEIESLKEKHREDLEKIRNDYDNKISTLTTQHQYDIVAIKKVEEEMRTLQDAVHVNDVDVDDVGDLVDNTKDAEHDKNEDKLTRTVQQRKRARRSEGDFNVSFFAKIVQNVHHLGQNQNVIFDTVITNNGNAYNRYVGAFVAPVDGTYAFSTTLVTYNTDVSHYGIYVNDNRTTILYVNGLDNTSDSASQTVVLQLQELDTVTVRHMDSDKALVGYHHSLFSGFLIAQDYSGGSTSIIGK